MIICRMMNSLSALCLTAFLTCANASPFSPYVDLTLQTHWDNTTQKIEPMDLLQPALSESIKSFHLAFITDSGMCQPAWGGFSEYSVDSNWGKRETDKLHQQKIEIIASFGGASGVDVSNHCQKSELISIFNRVVQQYHVKGLDFDIENGTADVPKLMDALQSFQKNHPDITLSFTLPVMPEGLTATGKAVVYAAERAGLRFKVNIMAMDYGPSYTGDMGDYAIMAAKALHKFLSEVFPNKTIFEVWQLIEVTPMIGVNDVNTEQFTLENATRLKTFADVAGLDRLSMWSFTRDKPCADTWANPNCSGNNLQSRNYEFVSRFR